MERRAITIRGVVQGVGFRPFVYGVASRLRLEGFVRNHAGSVYVEIQGRRPSIERFLHELRASPPPLARIDDVVSRQIRSRSEMGFRIEPSLDDNDDPIRISPDVATCDDCLAELRDPSDRRYRYPFLNCTNCGPRLTIIQAAPYDRRRTTMARFTMCPACQAEYDDPRDRRFHAQPTACPECGPRLKLLDASGQRMSTVDPLRTFVDAILDGRIGALKGLGGFHLVCDARDEQAVDELRRRKHRDEKPLAVMVGDVEAARQLCELDDLERQLLQAPSRPILLLRRRSPATGRGPLPASSVAPGNPYLAVMLPYTPLHHLLTEAAGDVPLVMTSGNRSDEPIVHLDQEVIDRLGDVADLVLTHDRPIHVRCEDSVTRIVDAVEMPVRRSRGYAPRSIKLPLECSIPMLAVGGQLKSVFALGRGRHAILSHHLGDLDHFAAFRAFQRDIDLYEQLFATKPEVLVHDLHPDYASTGYARRRADGECLQHIGAQHHHAHLASCMAEHGLDEPVLGVIFDGTGYGLDGAIWGGEFLVGDYAGFRRAAHLRYVQMPGGDKAIQEPWRMAVSHLLDADRDPSMFGAATGSRQKNFQRGVIDSVQLRAVEQMIARGVNSPPTSSVGRLFDAVAAIAGVRDTVSYEGQAAMELEWLAADMPDERAYPFAVDSDDRHPLSEHAGHDQSHDARVGIIDTRPMIRAAADDARRGARAAVIARRLHTTLAEIIAAVCRRVRGRFQVDKIVLSGGVFMNALLSREASARLSADGFHVYRHRLVPPNDGGLSLGQLAIAGRLLATTARDTSTSDTLLTSDTSPSLREGREERAGRAF